MHLLTNACQAIEGEGIITIATDVHQGKARIRVSDTGRGIPPEDLPRVPWCCRSAAARPMAQRGETMMLDARTRRGGAGAVLLMGVLASAAAWAAPPASPAPDSAAAPAAPSPPPPANTPIKVLADFEEAWRTGAADAVLECVSRHEVELALERTGPPGGRFPSSQAEFLIRDLLHYGETLDFRIIDFEWEDDAPRARAEWVHRMASGEIRERLDLGLALEGGRWCIVRIAAH